MRPWSYILSALFVVALAAPAMAANSITVKGSTTVLPIMQRAVEAFIAETGTPVAVSGGGSSNGIKALLDGSTDIAMASRKMKGKEIKLAESKKLTPVEHVIALDAVIPIVHPSNPVNNLTKDQLKAIYEGNITNWKEVGGPDAKIIVISRDTSSGTYETWHKIVMKKARVFPGALLQASSGAVLQAVSKNKNAIAYDGIGYINNTVKPLSVDGIKGSATTAKDKSYPVARTLQIYTSSAPSPAATQLVEFILSPKGQDIVEQAGFIRR
ncbi:phosphate ABC transporter substrate-binding protein [Halodesulfovibrio spirochaetisodalis]|uniref:Phosphate-binding protein n=1 Tax=Halodesulfovibrio spirochaetisodalis TaxID=1560234 RepID=A0A1B7XL02_9BACT|nr:phosphate ABC transporter substrate-binding protein [Halodesulfovibrio spirochaetisodalis]OBQ56189.1 phosphate ABC transporter substrate-binding protein [Halodesulfovibrio spirochaetisodalis]